MTFVGNALTKVFGSRNDRLLKKYRKLVQQINEQEPAARGKSDAQLRERTQELRRELVAGRVKIDAVLPEALAIMRESMDRHIGIREIFNPEQNFDPDKLDDEHLELYDSVQRQMIATGQDYRQVEIPEKLYDAVREMYPISRPPFRARCFDVQLIGGIVLSQGKIAEMKTGEGKTFVAPLAAFLRAIQGQHTHVVTVNDYLVARDASWVRPAFENVGFRVGYLQSLMMPGGPQRKDAYACDVTYGTNSEFGFDYLRDNMKERLDLQVQGPLDFAIIDEVDSILIDEARTPLIISGEASTGAPKYREADEVARYIMDLARPWQKAQDEVDQAKRLIKAAEGDMDKASGKEQKQQVEQKLAKAHEQLAAAETKQASTVQYYEVEMDKKSVHLTHEGIAAAQEKAGVGSFYVGDNIDWPHLMEQSMRAHVVYERDKDYVVEINPKTNQLEVVIVDEYTGRKMVGRQWSDGLHQACEAKENVPIKKETQTLATITLQNFFKLYKSLAGMTGTAQTEAEEFSKIYKLDVVSIPTNRPVIRVDNTDLVYRTEPEKWDAILDDIKANSDAGRPVLVGTTSVEKSEFLSRLLGQKHGIEHEVLNAKQHEREAHIVEHAGKLHTNKHGKLVGNVTIATNMAGRGTDIKPAPESFFDVKSRDGETVVVEQRNTGQTLEIKPDDTDARYVFQVDDGEEVVGGLHVVATERHTARRIDDQLRGRSGRQGDPGSSRFYVSLGDPLMKMFMPEWATNVLKKAGLEYGEPIESKLVTRQIAGAQKKVEERNYLARKNLLEYDEVMDVQRLQFYGLRQKVLEGRDIDQVIWDMIGESIDDAVARYVGQDHRASVLADWGRTTFEIQIDPEDLSGLKSKEDVDDLYRQKAKNEVGDTIKSTLGEFMGEDRTDTSGWDPNSIQSWARTRYGVELTIKEIKQGSADDLEDRLIEAAFNRIDETDTSGIEPYLRPLFPIEELCRWANDKFSLDLKAEELMADAERGVTKTPDDIIDAIADRAKATYRRREIEFPVEQVLALTTGGQERIENEQMAAYVSQWAKIKYGTDLSPQDVTAQTVADLRTTFLAEQQAFLEGEKLPAAVEQILAEGGDDPAKLAAAFTARFALPMRAAELERPEESRKGTPERDRDGDGVVDKRDVLLRKARYVIRKELTDLEQYVLINIFDQSWKDHLYAMDVLKGGIGLQGFAERDPRIAYKREGYRYFRQMMEGVRDRVTDLIFRVRVQGEQAPAAKPAYQETQAVHAQVDDNAAAFGAASPEQAAGDRATASATPAAPNTAPAPTAGQAQPDVPPATPKGSTKQPKKSRNKKGKRK
jgi:preprotein translocase subunit SecA